MHSKIICLLIIIFNVSYLFSQSILTDLSIEWERNKHAINIMGKSIDSTPYLKITFQNTADTAFYFYNFRGVLTNGDHPFFGFDAFTNTEIKNIKLKNLDLVNKDSCFTVLINYSAYKIFTYGSWIITDSLANTRFLKKFHNREKYDDLLPYYYKSINSLFSKVENYIEDRFKTHKNIKNINRGNHSEHRIDFSKYDIEKSFTYDLVFLKPGESYSYRYNLSCFLLIGGTYQFDLHWWDHSERDISYSIGMNRYSYTFPPSIDCFYHYIGEFHFSPITVKF